MHSTTQCHALVLGTTGTTYIRQQQKYIGIYWNNSKHGSKQVQTWQGAKGPLVMVYQRPFHFKREIQIRPQTSAPWSWQNSVEGRALRKTRTTAFQFWIYISSFIQRGGLDRNEYDPHLAGSQNNRPPDTEPSLHQQRARKSPTWLTLMSRHLLLSRWIPWEVKSTTKPSRYNAQRDESLSY